MPPHPHPSHSLISYSFTLTSPSPYLRPLGLTHIRLFILNLLSADLEVAHEGFNFKTSILFTASQSAFGSGGRGRWRRKVKGNLNER